MADQTRKNGFDRSRKQQISAYLSQEDQRVAGLARLYETQVFEDIRKSKSLLRAQTLGQKALKAQEKSILKIQAVIRGKLTREKVKVLQAERRVVWALKHLMTELSRPELQRGTHGKGGIIPFDSMLVDRLGKFTAQTKPQIIQNKIPREAQELGIHGLIIPGDSGLDGDNPEDHLSALMSSPASTTPIAPSKYPSESRFKSTSTSRSKSPSSITGFISSPSFQDDPGEGDDDDSQLLQVSSSTN